MMPNFPTRQKFGLANGQGALFHFDGCNSIAMLTSLGERPEPVTISLNRAPEAYQAADRYKPMYSHWLTRRLMKNGTLWEEAASIAPVFAMMGPTPQRSSRGARGLSSGVTHTQTTNPFRVGIQACVLPPNAAWICPRV